MIIDTDNLELSLPEVAALLLLYDKKLDGSRTVLEVKDSDILSILNILEKKGYITSTVYSTDYNIKPPFKHTAWYLLEKGKQALAENCVRDKAVTKVLSTKNLVKRCDALALRLMQIYPVGKKPGTSLMWRGNAKTVSERLQKVIIQGADFTDDEAVQATKNYVGGFNGIYTNMRVLPYFIFKNIIKGGEVEKTRDFLSYIDDLRDNPTTNHVSKDWDTELR